MQTDGTLLVPDVPTVPYITGDGVGAEVTPAMQAVVDAAIRKAYSGKRRIEWKEVLAGERSFNATGSWLPDETMETIQARHWTCMYACDRFVGIRVFTLRFVIRRR